MHLQTIEAGIFSLVPPLVAIVLALITKEVIFSLLLGIVSGTIIYSIFLNYSLFGFLTVISELIINRVSANGDMLIFLLMLGALLALIGKAGGVRAYGEWAFRRIKNPAAAGLSTFILGLMLFIDDYFSCLCTGNVMRPVTDKNKMSRAKLAYIVDTTAAPVCIIAPISSWAAAVIAIIGNSGRYLGMEIFIYTIPLNLYALLSIFMVFWFCLKPKSDFGPMAEAKIIPEDLKDNEEESESGVSGKGKISDLVIPIMVLVIFSGLAIINGEKNTELSDSAGSALVFGGLAALFASFFLYIPRGLMSIKEFFISFTNGFKSMIPALLILTFAWSISHVCHNLLSISIFMNEILGIVNFPLLILPAIFFAIACFLSFSTGTSWGTFGILIPIAIPICEAVSDNLTILCISAILGGGVFGDHSSPISDSTILASEGSRCNHLDHVKTQLPYALLAAIVSFLGYFIAGITLETGYAKSVIFTLTFSLAILVGALLIFPKILKNQAK